MSESGPFGYLNMVVMPNRAGDEDRIREILDQIKGKIDELNLLGRPYIGGHGLTQDDVRRLEAIGRGETDIDTMWAKGLATRIYDLLPHPGDPDWSAD